MHNIMKDRHGEQEHTAKFALINQADILCCDGVNHDKAVK